MASPIVPAANATRVVRLLRSRPIAWLEQNLIHEVAPLDSTQPIVVIMDAWSRLW
jgi:hypothetical protein